MATLSDARSPPRRFQMRSTTGNQHATIDRGWLVYGINHKRSAQAGLCYTTWRMQHKGQNAHVQDHSAA